ncbi:hypothetical protein GYA19_02265 [Candidatus Beckwithbacteria bacterium]|nr:hypothetical protein [Candidatus Beckwithbacteria bacterium]
MLTKIKNHPLFQKLKRKLTANLWLTRVLILLTAISLVFLLFLLLAKPVFSFLQRIMKGPAVVTTFFTDPLYTLPSYEGKTNILFLGMGGGNHEGADLTDTMIFISLDLKNNQVYLLSLPRDIWSASMQAKINTAYHYGEENETGGGYKLAEDAVYEIVGMPIHYVVSLDFSGFENIINLLGGVDVEIERSFEDKLYPIAGKENDLCAGDPSLACRYETINFTQGLQHMDGTTALKFVRSRHSEGEEGTDFARSQRQQKVMEAIKDKLISTEIIFNPKKLIELKNTGMQYIKFNKNISDKEYAAFASFGLNFFKSGKHPISIILDQGDNNREGFLTSPPEYKYGVWVLEPKSGSWTEFQEYLKITMQHNN